MKKNQFMSGVYTPVSTEFDDVELKIVSGAVPKGLKGTFYRNGPNPRFENFNNYHLFDGEGMIHAFNIQDGKINYKNKWVKTKRFNIESKFNKSVFGGILDFKGNRISLDQVNKAYNASNTNLIWYNDKLISLWEFGEPYEIDPTSLETIGSATHITTQHVGAFTAHPKIDFKTSEMLSVSYNGYLDLPSCYLNTFSLNAKAVGGVIDIPYRSMIHDFTFTDRYIVIPVLPAELDFSYKSNELIKWSPNQKAYISIRNRSFPYDLAHLFEIPSCFIYHFFNSYDLDNHTVVVDAIIHDLAPLFSRDENRELINPAYGKFVRWTFDLAKKSYAEEIIDDSVFHHFPHCDLRFVGKKNNICFSYAQDKEIHQLKKIDLGERVTQSYSAPQTYYLGEPYFVPLDASAGEAEGYVFMINTSYVDRKSNLLIFDSKNINQPIAMAELPMRIPLGFHGLWVGAL